MWLQARFKSAAKGARLLLHVLHIRRKTIVSEHHRIPLGSDELKSVQDSLLAALDAFHSFSLAHDVLYTLEAGSLLGFFRSGRMIEWDDDIDLSLRESDFPKIAALWEGGTNERTSWQGKESNWVIRDIELSGIPLILAVRKENAMWFKLQRENPKYPGQKIGGVDLSFSVTRDGDEYQSSNPKVVSPGPAGDAHAGDYPEILFQGVKTRALIREKAEPHLDRVYGKKWRVNRHPSLK
jgi:hypothetical protein